MSRENNYFCSVVIPVYNSEPTLQELVIRLQSALKENCSQFELLSLMTVVLIKVGKLSRI